MNRFIIFVTALFFSVTAWSGDIVPSGSPLANQYIVVMNQDQFTPPGLARAEERRNEVRGVAESMAGEFRGNPGYVFTDSLTGFSMTMDRASARKLARDPRVAYVAEDSWAEAADSHIQFDPPSWGLDRIDQRETELDEIYEHMSFAGETPVHVYVLDSGILDTHHDFGGRVDTENAFNAYTDGNGTDDCNGHGTHVAGTIGSDLHGVAKDVTLHPVRVLNCWGGGPVSAIIAGVDWVTARMQDNPHAAVANMSLVASESPALDDAVRASINAGVTYVVAAGNNGGTACNLSPARVAEAITVGSSNQYDERASSSNHGDCVDIYAPGVGIVSTYNRDDDDTISMTGTSTASPHVAGIAAKLIAQAPHHSPAEIFDLILANATEVEGELDTNGNSRLAYGLIELESAPPSSGPDIEFTAECRAQNQRCTFEAEVDSDVEIERYHWDFGDGNSRDHHRPSIGHRYTTGGTVTVVLAVELEDGEIHLADKQLELPF